MSDVLHANIFFFITSVAVVAVTILLAVALWYVIVILREVRVITQNVRKASEGLESDLEELRRGVRNSGTKFAGLINTLITYALGRLARPRRNGRKRTAEETDTDDSV